MQCPQCEHESDADLCPKCGAEMSVPDDMIEKASIPNLGAMLKRGKSKGYVTPQTDYGQQPKV